MELGPEEVARLRAKARRNVLTNHERLMFFNYLSSDASLRSHRVERAFDIEWLNRERALIRKSRASAEHKDGRKAPINWDEEQRNAREKRKMFQQKALESMGEAICQFADAKSSVVDTGDTTPWWYRIDDIAKPETIWTPDAFFDKRNSYKGHMQDFDFMGCYVIYNLTKNLYYVGQAKHVPNRVNAHLSGSGNGDVYADYKYGNQFEICLIDIMDTEYRRLDDLERDLITRFDAFTNGYNKTRGNR